MLFLIIVWAINFLQPAPVQCVLQKRLDKSCENGVCYREQDQGPCKPNNDEERLFRWDPMRVCLLVRLTRGLVVLNVWRLPKLTQNSRQFFFYEKDKEKQKLLNGNDFKLSGAAFLGIAVLFRDSTRLYIKRVVSGNYRE